MVVLLERQVDYPSTPTFSRRRNTRHIRPDNTSSLRPLAPRTLFPLNHFPPNLYAEEPVNCQSRPSHRPLATIRLRLRQLHRTCHIYHMGNTPKRNLLQCPLSQPLFLLLHMTRVALSPLRPQYCHVASRIRRRAYTHAHFLPLRLRRHQNRHFPCYLLSLLILLFVLPLLRYLGLFTPCYHARNPTHISDILRCTPVHRTTTSRRSRYRTIMLRTLTHHLLSPFRLTPPSLPKL